MESPSHLAQKIARLGRYLGAVLTLCALTALSLALCEGLLAFQFSQMDGLGLAQNDLWTSVESLVAYRQPVSLLHNLVLLASAILSLAWLARVANKVQQIGGIGPDFSPAKVLGIFLIPVINLLAPLGVIKHFWGVASEHAGIGCRIEPARLPRTWWFLYLLTVGMWVLSYRYGLRTGTPSDLAIGHGFSVLYGLSLGVLCVVFKKLSGKITRRLTAGEVPGLKREGKVVPGPCQALVN